MDQEELDRGRWIRENWTEGGGSGGIGLRGELRRFWK